MDLHLTAVLANDPDHDGKSQASAHAYGLGGEEGIEDASLNACGNAGAVVGDLELHSVVGSAAGGDADEGRSGVVNQGLAGVADQIEQNLLQLAGVAFDGGEGWREIQLHFYLV